MKKWIALVIMLAGAGAGIAYYLGNPQTSRETADYSHSAIYGGYPQSTEPNKPKILKNIGYVVGYSEIRKNPIWAAYRIFKVENPVKHNRPSRFKTDKRTEAKISHDDYTNSGYSRGHMAPNYVIDICFGKDAQLETFLMSNICPQKQSLNGGIWQNLEMKIAKKWGKECGMVWVICGPIFDDHIEKINSGVEIPDEFFMIVVDENNDNGSPRIRVLAFIFEHRVESERPTLQESLTTVDAIEERTGLDFLHELPDELENKIEAKKADSLW